MNLLYRFIGTLAAVWLTVELSQLADGHPLAVGLAWGGFLNAVLFVVSLAIINAVLRPIVKLFTLPLNCMTLGLFALVVNALLFWLAAVVSDGVKVPGFLAALFGSIVLSVLSGIINSVIKHKSEDRGR